jgi:hypothetical protein
MHHPYDDLAKKIGRRALAASGATTVEHTIPRSTQRADIRHDPDPARGAERALLGLLGRTVRILCLLEIYGHTPRGAEWRACLGKHFAHWETWARRTRAENRKQKVKGLDPEPFIKPMLWILTVAFSKPMRRVLEVKTGRAGRKASTSTAATSIVWGSSSRTSSRATVPRSSSASWWRARS